MSDDPETARQIAELARDTRPLLVLDVDDVLLEFISPFHRYVEAEGFRLKLDTFHLFENITHAETGEVADRDRVRLMIDTFFAGQADWQEPRADAAAEVERLARDVEVVMLTAMPHRHRDVRRQHLDRIGFPYPLVTTEAAKGPAIRQLRGESERPVAFVDDIPNNLISVRASVADAHLFHMMSVPDLRQLLPPLPERIVVEDDWKVAGGRIASALGVA
jgi:hypothetical protein